MDPITLLTVGPTVIRMIGNLFGGKTAEVANSVATVVDDVKGLPSDIARAELADHLGKMSPEQITALKAIEVQIAQIEKEREANRLAAETAQQTQVQETARVEAQSVDEYVRRTRPMLARKSAYVSFGYALCTGVAFQFINAIYDTELPGVDTWIVGALFAPCLTYMGVRTVDAFSKAGKT